VATACAPPTCIRAGARPVGVLGGQAHFARSRGLPFRTHCMVLFRGEGGGGAIPAGRGGGNLDPREPSASTRGPGGRRGTTPLRVVGGPAFAHTREGGGRGGGGGGAIAAGRVGGTLDPRETSASTRWSGRRRWTSRAQPPKDTAAAVDRFSARPHGSRRGGGGGGGISGGSGGRRRLHPAHSPVSAVYPPRRHGSVEHTPSDTSPDRPHRLFVAAASVLPLPHCLWR